MQLPTEKLTPRGNIMLVDDNPANLKLLEDMLLQHGYEVRSFPRGRQALAGAEDEPPDLILLDINMPEMNGYQVCEKLKSMEALSDIPIIFLSALTETQDKVRAFRSGGVDYISKPFQFEEVQARVGTHLQLHRLQRVLRLDNERLEEAVAARTRDLGKANDLLTILDRSKSDFLNLISHEFRTPLNGLLGVSELILAGNLSAKESSQLEKLHERSRRRILSLLDDALLFTQIDIDGDRFRSIPVSLSGALSLAIASAADFAESRGVAFMAPAADLGLILGDERLVVRAFHALLETAVKFSDKGETVRLTREIAPGSRTIVIESRGRTIPAIALPKFFDLFSIGEALTPGGDLGVGPPLASRIFSLFGASISATNREPSGIRLSISLKDPDNQQPGDEASFRLRTWREEDSTLPI